jgi:hypothetical protein
MIKALFLIFAPEASWNQIALARRGPGNIAVRYLLPMLLIVGAVECFGLVEWGRWQHVVGQVKKFPVGDALIYEISELLLMGVCIFVGAYLIKALGDTFRVRNTYPQTLTVVIYGLSPLFLLRLLDVSPTMSLWVPWCMGIALSAKILYHGVPRIMLPDPPAAFGLYLMSTLLLAMVTGLERFITIGYLAGQFRSIGDVISHIVTKLHL